MAPFLALIYRGLLGVVVFNVLWLKGLIISKWMEVGRAKCARFFCNFCLLISRGKCVSSLYMEARLSVNMRRNRVEDVAAQCFVVAPESLARNLDLVRVRKVVMAVNWLRWIYGSVRYIARSAYRWFLQR